jgi:uncharacterized membrane protein (Fun14 family)
MSEILSPLVVHIGIGGVGGFIVGYALKKLSKLVAVVIGLFVLALLYLSVNGIISVNYGALWNSIGDLLGGVSAAASWVVSIISLIPFVGSFVMGFLLGFKLG